jgi:hypothetical protein
MLAATLRYWLVLFLVNDNFMADVVSMDLVCNWSLCIVCVGFLQRLDAKYEENPAANAMLYDIIRAEVANKTAKGSSSCTNGMLWLTR